LIGQNPTFFLSCSPLAAIVSAYGLVDAALHKGVPENILQQKFTRTIPSQKWTLTVKPIDIVVREEKVTLAPHWGHKSTFQKQHFFPPLTLRVALRKNPPFHWDAPHGLL
jgi:molybdopterin biosynthesis enzyme